MSKAQSAEAHTLWGVRFFDGTAVDAVAELRTHGGLLVAPSGPGLALIEKDVVYHKALLAADIVLTDSGFMALVGRLRGYRFRRISGYLFLLQWLRQTDHSWVRDSLWVMPDAVAAMACKAWLATQGIELNEQNFYLAPNFRTGEPPEDPVLAARIREDGVRWLVINIGGGVQEPLGAWLKGRLPAGSGIICTGAAIAFLSGQQVYIPLWADRFYLGWLWRIGSQPRVYGKRYWAAWGLLPVLWREFACKEKARR